MKVANGKSIRLVLFGILGLLLLFESFSVIFARKAVLRVQSVVALLGSFTPGVTDRSDVEKRFLNLGIPLEDLPCSLNGVQCEGLGAGITNYPRFTLSEKIEFDHLLADLSVVRPTGIGVSFYFEHNRLRQILLIYGRDGSTVRIDRYLSSDFLGSVGISSRWNTNEDKEVEKISVSVTENEHSPRNTLADTLDLRCMSRIMGCHSARQLWPSAPAATEP